MPRVAKPKAAKTKVFLDIQERVTYNDNQNEEGFLGLTFDVNTDYTKVFKASGPSLLPRGKIGPTLADLERTAR